MLILRQEPPRLRESINICFICSEEYRKFCVSLI